MRWDSFTHLDALASPLLNHRVFVSAAPIRGYPGDCGDPQLDCGVFAGAFKILVKAGHLLPHLLRGPCLT
jgi:hypothetical protein